MKKLLLLGIVLLFQTEIWAASGVVEVEIIIKNHRFIPEKIEVPSGKKIRLIVHNKDDTVEEFESHKLKREKIIPGGSKGVIILPPLNPGIYEFFGEFHEETAQGCLIVK